MLAIVSVVDGPCTFYHGAGVIVAWNPFIYDAQKRGTQATSYATLSDECRTNNTIMELFQSNRSQILLALQSTVRPS